MDRYGGVYDAQMPSPRNLAAHFKTAWERAAKDGAARPGIWAPGNRVKASTTHVLQAVYQAMLEEAGVARRGDRLAGRACGQEHAGHELHEAVDRGHAGGGRTGVSDQHAWSTGYWGVGP